jgi:alkyl hydroperoxide reductase subunit AhpC
MLNSQAAMVVLAVVAGRAAAFELAPGVQLSYRGSVARRSNEPTVAQPEKRFDLWLLAAGHRDGAIELHWTLDESGRGQSPWPNRFGVWKLGASLLPADESGPSLLYDHDSQPTAIKLPVPLLRPPAALAVDAAWTADRWKYHVENSDRLEDRECWRIRVSNEYGRKRTVWLDKKDGQVVGIDERVFMGRGEEYEVQLRLAASTMLSGDELAKHNDDFGLLAELRDNIATDPQQLRELSASQRALLGELLPLVEQSVTSMPLVKIVGAARQDLVRQTGLANRIGELIGRFEGRAVETFEARGPKGDFTNDKELQGKVTVLHFWEYRDEPLREPYGQIGYLEFLYDKRKAQGVQVYGIAVDGRFADDQQRPSAIRSVNKLLAFMNITYPVLLDDGRLLKKFGDPRAVGGQLPLFVVVGPDRKIAHYFVGCYPVDRDAGLKQLDEVLARTLKEQVP